MPGRALYAPALGPSGGLVSKVGFNRSSPTTVYAIAGSGFYRSVDGGATWQFTASSGPNDFADLEIDPSNPNRVYVIGANSQPMMSTDGGMTFSGVAGYPPDPSYLLQISSDGSTLYATSVSNVYRSTDRAQSWRAATAVLADYPYGPVQQLLIDPNNADLLYATVADSAATIALFRSTDGAASRQLLSSLPDTATTTDLPSRPTAASCGRRVPMASGSAPTAHRAGLMPILRPLPRESRSIPPTRTPST